VEPRFLEAVSGAALLGLEFGGIEVPVDFGLGEGLPVVPFLDPVDVLGGEASVEVELVEVFGHFGPEWGSKYLMASKASSVISLAQSMR